jgi:digeranylgeranylglycerophospholipid reductase
MIDEYDVIVVGGGPAGSITAKIAAEKGCSVLLLEKRQEIGDPFRCGELCSKDIVSRYIDLDQKWISAEVSCTRLYSPDGTPVIMKEGINKPDIVLERRLFDIALAQNAAKAGVEISVKTCAIGVIKDNKSICGVKIISHGEDFEIKSKIVVGADGIESKIGHWAGLNTTLKLKDIETCAQFIVTNVDINQNFCELFVGNKVAPGGHAWIFPKGNRMANVGIGVSGDRTKEEEHIEYLKRFVNDRFPYCKTVGPMIGTVPVSKPIEKATIDGLLLVGDAACQTDPIVGEGISNAIECAKIAGSVIADAISKKDYSTNVLNKYEKEWRAKIGKTIEKNYRIKELLSKMTDKQLDDLAHLLKDVKFSEMGSLTFVKQLAKHNPRMFFELRSLL